MTNKAVTNSIFVVTAVDIPAGVVTYSAVKPPPDFMFNSVGEVVSLTFDGTTWNIVKVPATITKTPVPQFNEWGEVAP